MDNSAPTPGKPPANPMVVQAGPVQAAGLQTTLERERQATEETQAQPVITGIAGHVRTCWEQARIARMNSIDDRMLANMRARRNEYDPDKLAKIRSQVGGSEIYANLTSVKCRAAGSWIRDVLMGSGSERPWTLRPQPIPELPPKVNEEIVQNAVQPIMAAQQSGQPMAPEDIRTLLMDLKDQARAEIEEEARNAAERMADKMETQLNEGGFRDALDAFIDDLTTFPAAIIKGPVMKNKNELKWSPDGKGGFAPKVEQSICMEWERVDPFMIYPSPAATTVNDGFLIQRHRMLRGSLVDLIGVDGYDSGAIRAVLEEYGRGGLRDWVINDTAMASAKGQSTIQIAQNVEGTIDALQFWGSVQGQWLIDWGMDAKDVPDPTKEYNVECWLIGSWVIKAILNYDPLGRKPYYKASYEDIPGNWWGNAVADLVRDSQTVVNAAARALVNNMGIASGPQVVVNAERVPTGEDLTSIFPWKIWQVTNDQTGGSSKPIEFYQPDSRVAELSGIFDKFSAMADEYSGIPKYLAGDSAGTAGRTATGLSMLMGNAGKSIKQVISNVDMNVIKPLLEKLYAYNMQYATDEDLKGDINIIARGSSGLIAKEATQQRRQEFLAATANPIDMQVIGIEGRAAILHEVAKGLDMDTDKIVPTTAMLRQKLLAANALAQEQAQQNGPAAPNGQSQAGPQTGSTSGQTLPSGAPVSDHFSPMAAPPK